ncbi:hypothetical protein KP509_32G009000 [Ceratopteris richardii]|uniref:RING-type domain-containing protein n=1 Tax=Ceratopteris richardii TaxID=49495 RepID=A0A8T2QSM1_CERRI|nr:hypothetical protein KP509_32G009000 [Ceratopteris richardii]
MSATSQRELCSAECFCEHCIPLRVQQLEELSLVQKRYLRSGICSPQSGSLSIAPTLERQQPSQGRPGDISYSTQTRLMWDVPEHVAELVPNIIDGFETIHMNLEAYAGPRRRRAMHEAMQQVLHRLSGFGRSVIRNPPPTQKIVIVVIDDAKICTFNRAAVADTDPEMCTVCSDDYQNGEELAILSCLHTFHKKCIEEWICSNYGNPKSNTDFPNVMEVTCANCRSLIRARFRKDGE